MVMSQKIHQSLVTKINMKITHLKCHSNLPGANDRVKVNKKSSQVQTCGAVFHRLVPIVLPGPTGHPAPSLAGWKQSHWSMVLPGPYLPCSSDGASGTKGFWSLFSVFLFRKTVEGWRWGSSGRVQCGASAVHEIVGAVSPLALGCPLSCQLRTLTGGCPCQVSGQHWLHEADC